jgi:hypothetical protein
VPEPEPDSLDESVDWLTYSHPELYSMVHKGLDLTGAMAVSAKWARLGDELGEIGDELTRLLAATTEAWQGDAADLARGSVSSLADWSTKTGTGATEVSGCVTIQVDNATAARNGMPKPPYPMHAVHPGHPQVSQLSQSGAFTSGDFGTATPLVADPVAYSDRERALHQQAARTMEQFQANSRDVYVTVPRFVQPDLTRMPFSKPEPVPTPTPTPMPTPTPPQQAPPAPVPPGGAGGDPAPTGPGPGTQSPGAPVRSEPVPFGPGSGANSGETALRPAAAAAAAGTSARPGAAPGTGGMPMGGGGARGGNEDVERKSKYSKQDEDIWGAHDQRVMPPVIGEVNRRA